MLPTLPTASTSHPHMHPSSDAAAQSDERLFLDEEQSRSRADTVEQEFAELSRLSSEDEKAMLARKGGTLYLAQLRMKISDLYKQIEPLMRERYDQEFYIAENRDNQEPLIQRFVQTAEKKIHELNTEIALLETSILTLNQELRHAESAAPWDKKIRAKLFYNFGDITSRVFGDEAGRRVTEGCCSLFGKLLDGAKATPRLMANGGAAALETVAGREVIAIDEEKVKEIQVVIQKLRKCDEDITQALQALKDIQKTRDEAREKIDEVPKLWQRLPRLANTLYGEEQNLTKLQEVVGLAEFRLDYYHRLRNHLAETRSNLISQIDDFKERAPHEYRIAETSRVSSAIRNVAGRAAQALRRGAETPSSSSGSDLSESDSAV